MRRKLHNPEKAFSLLEPLIALAIAVFVTAIALKSYNNTVSMRANITSQGAYLLIDSPFRTDIPYAVHQVVLDLAKSGQLTTDQLKTNLASNTSLNFPTAIDGLQVSLVNKSNQVDPANPPVIVDNTLQGDAKKRCNGASATGSPRVADSSIYLCFLLNFDASKPLDQTTQVNPKKPIFAEVLYEPSDLSADASINWSAFGTTPTAGARMVYTLYWTGKSDTGSSSTRSYTSEVVISTK